MGTEDKSSPTKTSKPAVHVHHAPAAMNSLLSKLMAAPNEHSLPKPKQNKAPVKPVKKVRRKSWSEQLKASFEGKKKKPAKKVAKVKKAKALDKDAQMFAASLQNTITAGKSQHKTKDAEIQALRDKLKDQKIKALNAQLKQAKPQKAKSTDLLAWFSGDKSARKKIDVKAIVKAK